MSATMAVAEARAATQPAASGRAERVAWPERADWRSEKIRSWHLERLAVVYVRQSTPQQVT